MPDDRRCDRCGIPHSESEAAGKNGGISWFVDGTCIVCIDYLEEHGHE